MTHDRFLILTILLLTPPASAADAHDRLPADWSPKLAADEVLARLITITAPQVKGAHDAELALVQDRVYVVAEVNSGRPGECAGYGPRAGNVSPWARLIRRVFEVDPLACPQCVGAMKISSFIERRRKEVIERILRHCGLWEGPLRTLAHPRAPPVSAEPDEDQPQELQLVLDPEFL